MHHAGEVLLAGSVPHCEHILAVSRSASLAGFGGRAARSAGVLIGISLLNFLRTFAGSGIHCPYSRDVAKLSQAVKAIAINLQETFSMLEANQMHGNVRAALSQAISDGHRDSGNYGYYVDHSGDGASGDVIYQSGGKLKKAPYTGTKADGKSTWAVNMEKAKPVTAVTSYKESGAGSAAVAADDSTSRIPPSSDQSDRSAYRSSDTDGKRSTDATRESGNRAADQPNARAGERDNGGQRESVGSRDTLHNSLQLIESASTLENIVLREARADYEIKLIAPGDGSSAHYPEAVLKRDGPKVFGAGTHVYLNHPTAAEEAARPVGDVKNLAGVLTTGAVYHETHTKGPGLYARMKVFADHGTLVEEKAAHVGMSIRASGIAEAGQKKNGLPVLKQLTSAESVDVVTRAGAGGRILTESANGPKKGEVEMDEAQIKALIESGIKTGLAAHKDNVVLGLLERARKGDATVIATRTLASVTLAEASKQRVIDSVLRGEIPVTEAGAVDETKLVELVNAEAKREGAYVAQLLGSGRITGMGAAPVQIDEAERKRQDEAAKAQEVDAVEVFTRFGLTEAQAKAAAGREAA